MLASVWAIIKEVFYLQKEEKHKFQKCENFSYNALVTRYNANIRKISLFHILNKSLRNSNYKYK